MDCILYRLRAFLLATVFLSLVPRVHGTHGIAGDITYRYLGNNRFEITLTTYSNPCEAGVDDCVARLYFYSVNADGTTVFLSNLTIDAPRINGPLGSCDGASNLFLGDTLRFVNPSFCVKKNVYRVLVDFPGPGIYQVRYPEFSRLSNISNMTASNNVWWYFSSDIVFSTSLQNNSVNLLSEPIDQACIGELWSHNPSPIDPDGDSLVFSLIPPQQWDPNFTGLSPTDVPNHRFPDNPDFGTSDFVIDPVSGLVSWNTPQQAGIYAIAIRVEEFRNGTKVGEVIRDMAIIVDDVCTNRAPQIETISDTCIKPLQELRFFILARDPDPQDSVYFYLVDAFDPIASAGGIFDPSRVIGGVARLDPPNNWILVPQLTGLMSGPGDPPASEFPVVTEFIWTPECTDIRSSSYAVNLYAHDRLEQPAGVTLATDRIVTLDVLGPPVYDVTATAIGNQSIQVSWNPAACTSINGYSVYRAPDSLAVPLDSCCTNNPGAGYQLVGSTPPGTTTFIDGPGLPFSGNYCYRVVVEYLTGSGTVPGCPSEQACVQQEIDQPVLLEVDVTNTSTTAGSINLRWRQPAELDPSFFTPPFEYRLQQATGVGGTAFAEIATFPNLTDTTFIVSGLNTEADGYSFRVDVFDADDNFVISSAPASSVFLSPIGEDLAVRVNWSLNTPWTNTRYELFRSETGINGTYTQLTTQLITTPGQQDFSFLDANVEQGTNYCYFVRTTGTYNNPAVHTDSLLNRSNRACAVPRDEDPPCALPATLTCNPDGITVTLTVTEPPDSCGADIDFYLVRLRTTDEPRIIDTLEVGPGTVYPIILVYGLSELPNLAGCLSFQPVDLSGNIGEVANEVCVSDICPLFQLPNVFTPNGDGSNDRFTPLDYTDPVTGQVFLARGVVLVQCIVYDRTGRVVNRSTDLNNLWDGTINGAPAPEGQYFYYINFVLDSLENPRRIERTGSISLLR